MTLPYIFQRRIDHCLCCKHSHPLTSPQKTQLPGHSCPGSSFIYLGFYSLVRGREFSWASCRSEMILVETMKPRGVSRQLPVWVWAARL